MKTTLNEIRNMTMSQTGERISKIRESLLENTSRREKGINHQEEWRKLLGNLGWHDKSKYLGSWGSKKDLRTAKG